MQLCQTRHGFHLFTMQTSYTLLTSLILPSLLYHVEYLRLQKTAFPDELSLFNRKIELHRSRQEGFVNFSTPLPFPCYISTFNVKFVSRDTRNHCVWVITEKFQKNGSLIMPPSSNLVRLGMGWDGMAWNLEECWCSWPPLPFISGGDRWSGRIKAPQGDPGCPSVGQVQREQVGICSASVIGPSHMTLRLCVWPARAFGLN